MNKLLIILAVVILNLFLVLPGFGQESKMLSGIVLNDAKEPVSDVTINIPGSKPVFTGADGTFDIPRVNEEEWLHVTPLEKYSAKKILLTDQESITIYISSKDIVSPYSKVLNPMGDISGRDMISSYKVLNPAKFENQPYTSTEQYIQGNVAGAFVTQNSGMPGSGGTVYLRGYSSLLSNNQPLYIVDGVPVENANIYEGMLEGANFNPLATLDPLDISEITILKDAASTALYGAKGANGVILIKTLEPKETKTTIDFLFRTGISMAPDQLPQLDSKAYKTLANEVLFSSGMDDERYKYKYQGLFMTPEDDGYVRYSHNHNWQDEVFDNALMTNVRFSIKGGDAVAKYGLAVGYLNNEGVVKHTSYDRLNIRLVGTFDVFSWLKMGVSSNLTTSNAYVEESGLSSVTNPILSALWKSPMLNPFQYDEDDRRLELIDETYALGTSNPAAIVSLSDARSKNYRFMTSVNLTGEITENLKFKSVLGINSNSNKEFLFIPDQGFDDLVENEIFNQSKAQNNAFFSFYNDNRIFYNKEFNHIHNVYAVIGARWQKNTFDYDFGIGGNTGNDYFTNLDRSKALYRQIGGNNRAWNWGSLYSNVSYGYADKYLLTATLTSDISSRIGDNAANTAKFGDIPVGLFYSVGGAWRISNEKFFPNLAGIEELKLRASYGIAGNDDIGETNSFSNFVVGQYQSVATLIPGGLANNELTFQTKKQVNVGIDFSALGNRLNASVNYFNNVSENILILELQNSYLGYDTYPSNSGVFSTKGFEAEVFGRLISRSDFSFDIGFNISKYSTVVDAITTGEQITDAPGGMQIINREGEPVNSFYGYKYTGVYASTAQAAEANMVNYRRIPYQAGDAIYENVADADGNVDNVIDKNDKQLLGSFEPDFYGGVFINSRYKNFSLSMLFQGVYGNEVYNYVRQQNEKMTGLENQSVKTLQRWQYEDQVTMVPRATWGDPIGNSAFSDRWIEDGSYLRLKSLTIAYDVKQKVFGLSGLKVYATASNLFTLSTYLGYDPEFSYSQDMMLQGVDYANTPISKQFMVGVKIGL